MAKNSKNNFDEKTSGLRHMALRNALYHLARRRWYEGISRWFNFLIILLGTSTAAQFATDFVTLPNTPIYLGGITAAIGAAQLAFNLSGRARDHEILQQKYFHLMAEIEECIEPNADKLAKFTSEFSRIAGDEPPTMRALDAIADNQATSALLGSSARRLKVSWFQSITRHILAHNGGDFAPIVS